MENINKLLFCFFILFVILFFATACAKTEKETATETKGEVQAADAKSIFSNLLANKAKTFMVSYDMKGEEISKMTMYFKGGKIRYDVVSDSQEVSLFFIDNKAYSCTKSPKMCIISEQAQKPSTGTESVEKNIEQSTIVSKPSRVIAGKTAKCFEVSNAQGSFEVCYSNEGIMLYSKVSLQGKTFEMTATDYSTTVQDSVFELPAEPQDINAMMAKYQQ